MLYDLDIDKQREQFVKVIKHLTQNGTTHKEIAKRIGVTTYDISHLKSGKIKNVSKEIIDNLQAEFSINPNYILKGASNMYDIPEIKYTNFKYFVDDWDLVTYQDLVTYERKEYLHFIMDENFYKFLIDVHHLKEASKNSDNKEKMEEALNKASESLKENFPDSSNPKEYVLIPVTDQIEFASDNVPRIKALGEVIDMFNALVPINKQEENKAD